MNRLLVASVLVAVGVGLVGCEPPPPPYVGPPNPHIAWCLAHHPGYDPRSNLFPTRWGGLRPCRGPAFGPPPPPPPPPL